MCYLWPRCVLNLDGTISRYIDVLERMGANRGVRLTLRTNTRAAGVRFDNRERYSLLYGRGQGEVSGDGYATRITFSDVLWSIANGDPVDKPAGQEYVEDVAATAEFGRNGAPLEGVVIFEDETDAEKLLERTWAYLQEYKYSKVTIKSKVFDLVTFGYSYQPIRYGDDVTLIIDDINLQLTATVSQNRWNVSKPEQSVPTIGYAPKDLVYKIARGE